MTPNERIDIRRANALLMFGLRRARLGGYESLRERAEQKSRTFIGDAVRSGQEVASDVVQDIGDALERGHAGDNLDGYEVHQMDHIEQRGGDCFDLVLHLSLRGGRGTVAVDRE